MQVALESKWLSWRHGLQQRDACLRDWSTQSKGLEVRVQAALEEYSREVAAKAAGQVAMEAQTALCRELQEKVVLIETVDPQLPHSLNWP